MSGSQFTDKVGIERVILLPLSPSMCWSCKHERSHLVFAQLLKPVLGQEAIFIVVVVVIFVICMCVCLCMGVCIQVQLLLKAEMLDLLDLEL